MGVLDVIPHTYFATLSAPLRREYAAALESVFRRFFDDFVVAPKKAEVLQAIHEALSGWVDSPSDGAETAPNAPENDREAKIYAALRDDKWLLEVVSRRSIEVFMPREAHALLSALIGISEELSVDISAEASLVDSGIIAAYQDPAGKAVNIASARRQAILLRRSIDGVLTSLHRIEDEMMQTSGLAELLATFMDRFVEKLLLANYRALKTSSYNPMRFQRSILQHTARFLSDDGQLARAAVSLAEQGISKDIQTAREQIISDLTKIRDVFAQLGEKLDLIDRFSHKLERRISMTLRYQETGRNVREEAVKAALKLAFTRMASGEALSLSPFPGLLVPYSIATLANPKKARDPVKPSVRQPKQIDPADVLRETLTDAYITSMAVTPEGISARLNQLVGDTEDFSTEGFVPECARDIAILYELRAGDIPEPPGWEFLEHGPVTKHQFVSGPKILLKRRSGG
jgi:hypothetical protein